MIIQNFKLFLHFYLLHTSLSLSLHDFSTTFPFLQVTITAFYCCENYTGNFCLKLFFFLLFIFFLFYHMNIFHAQKLFLPTSVVTLKFNLSNFHILSVFNSANLFILRIHQWLDYWFNKKENENKLQKDVRELWKGQGRDLNISSNDNKSILKWDVCEVVRKREKKNPNLLYLHRMVLVQFISGNTHIYIYILTEWYFDSEIIFISRESFSSLVRHAFSYVCKYVEMNRNVNCDDENKVFERGKKFSLILFCWCIQQEEEKENILPACSSIYQIFFMGRFVRNFPYIYFLYVNDFQRRPFFEIYIYIYIFELYHNWALNISNISPFFTYD